MPPPIPCSLAYNKIGDEGASALAAILKETQITELMCAATRAFTFESMPAATFANTSLHVPTRVNKRAYIKRALVLPWSLSESTSYPASCTPSTFSSARYTALDRAPRAGPRPRPPVGRVDPHARSRTPTSPPCDLPRRSLRHNGLDGKAKQIVKDAEGSGFSIAF